MTWHPLATHPLPEPREGQVLLIIRSDHPRSTRAHELCRSYGLDPDETVGGNS